MAGAAEVDGDGDAVGDGADGVADGADFGRDVIGEGEVLLFHVLGGAFTSRHA